MINTWSGEELSPQKIHFENRGRCVVSVERLSQKRWWREEKQQSINSELCMRVHRISADQNANSITEQDKCPCLDEGVLPGSPAGTAEKFWLSPEQLSAD